jgi:acetyl-CoA C-acetyltransferase
MVGDRRFGSHPLELAHGADFPTKVYPLLENALRAREGLSLDGQRRLLGEFAEQFSAVAAANPHAWHRQRLSAAEALTPGPGNRMIAFPYPKRLNAVIEVDQGASLLMTTVAEARRLGIAEDRWVHLHGGQDAHDLWYLSERPDLGDSPAIRACVGDTLAQAGMQLDQVDAFDLYSCFPCMVRLTRQAMGLGADDPRPMTLTGGLPFFGGPGNNYSMHAIAEAVQRCRRRPRERILITANGWYATKHACGLYGAEAPDRPWHRTPPRDFQHSLRLPLPVRLTEVLEGHLRVEAYTVLYDRSGEPHSALVCGRSADDSRGWAITPPGARDDAAAMTRGEWVGRVLPVRPADGGVNHLRMR